MHDQQHYIFPVLQGELPGGIEYSFGPGFGLTRGSDQIITKFNLELERFAGALLTGRAARAIQKDCSCHKHKRVYQVSKTHSVIDVQKALSVAEEPARKAEFVDQARIVSRIFGQLIPANEALRDIQTAVLPLLALAEWAGTERWDAWQREFYGLTEPKAPVVADPTTIVTFTLSYSLARPV